jgi:hypothetical protein
MKTLAPIAAAVLTLLASCGGGASSSVVSCDVQQGGLHYCEEFHGPTSGSTGCPNMAGFTPGSGCSRADLAGTCATASYEVFFYGGAPVASAVSSVCPGGTFMAGAGGSTDAGATNHACTVTYSGGATLTMGCIGRVLPNQGGTGVPFVDFQEENVGGPQFRFRMLGAAPPAAGTYSTASVPQTTSVTGSATAATGNAGGTWTLGEHTPPDPSAPGTGQFSLTITSLTDTANGEKAFHGTLDATYVPFASPAASGNLTVHVVAP